MALFFTYKLISRCYTKKVVGNNCKHREIIGGFLMEWYLKALKNYAGFEGRARRKEYWMFGLFNVLIGSALLLLMAVSESLLILAVIYYLGILVPSLAVTIRRLHDIGKSGWWILINFVPFVGGLILLIFTCLDSQTNDNQFGPSPKTQLLQAS
jgi:uncharacterized membrane protein YhaH (DUF805 family)